MRNNNKEKKNNNTTQTTINIKTTKAIEIQSKQEKKKIKQRKTAKACTRSTNFARGKAFSLHNVSEGHFSHALGLRNTPNHSFHTHVVLCNDSGNRRGESACHA